MHTLYTKSNRLIPANSFQVAPSNILCNDVILPREIDSESGLNPHNVRLWVIGHNFGVVCAVWASCEQDALDEACDHNMMESFIISEEDTKAYYSLPDDGERQDSHGFTSLGNAGELHNLDDCYIGEVDFQAARDIQLIVKLVRAQEQGQDNLDF